MAFNQIPTMIYALKKLMIGSVRVIHTFTALHI